MFKNLNVREWVVDEVEFRGRPVLRIRSSVTDKFALQIGYVKARKILENLNAIRDFVGRHGDNAE